MQGCVFGEFAGTVVEAKEFAKKEGFNVGHLSGPNHYPDLSIPFKNKHQFEEALARFDQVGWDRDSVEIKNYSG